MNETASVTARVWHQFHDPLQRFVARRLPSAADVEDVLQTVFLNFHRVVGTGTVPDAPGAWLFHAARNTVRDRWRSERRRRVDTVGSTDAVELAAAAAVSLAPEQTRPSLGGCVRPLINQLPGAYREALTLTELDGLTQAEAARHVGVTLPGMKARVQRGRRHLRSAFLECCETTFDRRGGIVAARLRAGRRSPCRAHADDAAAQPVHLSKKAQEHS